MTETTFWELISTSKTQTTEDKYEQTQFLTNYLSTQTEEEIFSFEEQFQKLYAKSYTSPLWCAAYVAMGGCSDDSFDYFRAWLIAQGKEVFENAMQNPDSLVPVFDTLRNEGRGDYPGFERMLGVPLDAYIKKYNFADRSEGMDAYYTKLDKFPRVPFPEIVLNWEEDDIESMKKICPAIFANYWDDPF
ncbi:DUF4240 domain-containing protein [Cytophagaceae bacterium YF14B1]|uniref:DUF4240 domain-containing protein n=1 Tax=Xanthocytophaga flava TaxID=3048013 RepID=A0AAE3QUF6_9BACT|nr:DUF4240 domain-containing protein [Xanthocytophaga flavus]MDJ1483445.1 DUF4240 domain-containing protein [Xanthocytophaga flavus]